MAMAADSGRGQQQPMDIRRALQDGRAVLAGGPGLGSQMILLRNEALPPSMPLAPHQQPHHYTQQQPYALPQQQQPYSQPYSSQQQQQYSSQPQQQQQYSTQQQANGSNVVTQEYSYPVQGYGGQPDDPSLHGEAEVGAPGTTPEDQGLTSNPNMPSAMQGYASSTVSSGQGYHMEYAQPAGPPPESYVQPYPNAQSYPATYPATYPASYPATYPATYPAAGSNYDASMHPGAAQQAFFQPGYGIAAPTETSVNPPPAAAIQESGTSGFPAAAPVNRGNFRASSTEDDRRLAMIHEFGNDSHSQFQNQPPHFPSQYPHPIPLDQVASLPTVEYLAKQITLQQQRIREMELQHLWRRQLEIDLQRRRYEQLKQQEQNMHRRSGSRGPKDSSLGLRRVRPQGKRSKGSSRFPQRSSERSERSDRNRKRSRRTMPGPEGPGWCELCQTDCCTDEMLQFHLAGKRHQRKLELLNKDGEDTPENQRAGENMKHSPTGDDKETKDPNTDSNSSDQNLPDGQNPGMEMELKHDFSSLKDSSVEPPAKRAHVFNKDRSVKDQQALQKSLLTERCDVCDIACNTRAVLELHFKGKKHAQNLKKYMDSAQYRRTGSFPRVPRNDAKEETSGNGGKGFSSGVVEEQSREGKADNHIGNADAFKSLEEGGSEKPKENLSLEEHVRVFAIASEKFQA